MPTDGEKVDLKNELDEDILDSPNKDELQANPDGRYDLEDVEKSMPHMDDTYESRLQTALVSLKQNSSKIFTKEHLLKDFCHRTRDARTIFIRSGNLS